MNKKKIGRNQNRQKAIRITIMLDKPNSDRLRSLQAKLLQATQKNISFSHVINQVIKVGLKYFKKEKVEPD